MKTRARENQQGVTLIELMIGMVIGLMVLGAIISVYLSARQTARANDNLSRMQENGRFALELISNHLAHAGYFGIIIDPAFIQGIASSGNPLPSSFRPADDCAVDWYISLDPSLRAYQGAASGSHPFATTCINNVSNSRQYRANSDLLEIRNADTTDLGNAPTTVPGTLYVRADFSSGELVDGSMTLPAASNFAETVETHQVFSSIYYVADHDPGGSGNYIPYLMRAEQRAESGGAVINNYALFPGIEQLQIELGIDVDGDCDVDFWQPPGIAANETLITALRLWVLVRSEEHEAAGYLDTRTYQLGDLTYDPDPDDRFRRLPMVKTVKLRNINEMRPDLNDASEVNCQ